MKKYIVGIDVGGTHIDGVLLNNKEIIKFFKMPYNKEKIVIAIDKLINEITLHLNKDEIQKVQLSTTISTNAIVNKTGRKSNLIIESGPGINNDFSHLDAQIYKLSSYVNHQGVEIVGVLEEELKAIKENLDNDYLGIIGKFSNRNPQHELLVKDYFKDSVNYISLGHLFSGNLNFPRRVDTTFLNNYVYDAFTPFAKSINKQFKNAHILKADGGTLPLAEAIKYPVQTIMSGPAASFMGMKALLDLSGDGVLFDIGGSTTDIFFVVDGKPLFEPKGISIDKYKTLIRSIYSYPLNIGGDSQVIFKSGKYKFLKRVDFAAGFGGKDPTLSDALIVLSDLKVGNYKKAKESLLSLNDESAKKIANDIVSAYLDIVYKQVADIIFEINSKTVYTISEVLEDKQFKPQFLAAIGGPANALKRHFKAKFNLKYYTPKAYAYANALGAALSLNTKEVSIIANTKVGKVIATNMGYQKRINRNYTVSDAINLAKSLLDDDSVEIIEKSSFNMVSYGQLAHKNIRVKAQIMPRLIYDLKEQHDEK